MKQQYSIQQLDESSIPETLDFLRKHEDYCLFLLGNLETYGPNLTSAPNSGNFKIVQVDGVIAAVFCLCRRGSLLIQSTIQNEPFFEQVLKSCQEEKIPVKALLGEWNFCESLWDYLKKKDFIRQDNLIEKDILYTIDLRNLPPQQENVRLLKESDFSPWNRMEIDYLKEQHLPDTLSESQRLEEFHELIKGKIAWGYFLNGKFVARAHLNAKAFDLGQVGGVYTVPEHRRKGFSKTIMLQLMRDAVQLHHLRKLMIFTGEKNTAARNVYESLGVKPKGHFALLFGSS